MTSQKHIFWALGVLALVGIVAIVTAIKRHQQPPATGDAIPKETSAPAPQAVPPSAAEGIKDTPTIVLELFNPSDETLTQQLSETTIRQNIEQVLSTSFVLSRCGVLDSNANSDIFRASVAYAVNTHFAKDIPDAVGKIQALHQSAAATYVMLYRNTDCKNPTLKTIAAQMVKWQTYYLSQHGRKPQAATTP